MGAQHFMFNLLIFLVSQVRQQKTKTTPMTPHLSKKVICLSWKHVSHYVLFLALFFLFFFLNIQLTCLVNQSQWHLNINKGTIKPFILWLVPYFNPTSLPTPWKPMNVAYHEEHEFWTLTEQSEVQNPSLTISWYLSHPKRLICWWLQMKKKPSSLAVRNPTI